MPIIVPAQLRESVDEDDYPQRLEWLQRLPQLVATIAAEWELELEEPYLPGGQCAWVAPATDATGAALALKVGWRHREAEHEADALREWDGDGAVTGWLFARCAQESVDANALSAVARRLAA